MSADDNMCNVRREIEEKCKPACSAEFHHYEECARRIHTYDSWDLGKLQSEFLRRGEPVKSSKGVAYTKEELAAQIKSVAHCTPQHNHFYECLDRCVAPRLGAVLK